VPKDPVDRLFEAPPDEFVSERDELVRSLKEKGQDDLAAEAKALRRPTLPADLGFVLADGAEVARGHLERSWSLSPLTPDLCPAHGEGSGRSAVHPDPPVDAPLAIRLLEATSGRPRRG
jgi:hypothetical protein